MPTEPSPFIWYELLTTDPTAAAAFYSAVVGWTVTDSGQPGMDYRILNAGPIGIGGLMALPPDAAAIPPGWFSYVAVPDVDATIAAITAAGGSLCMPATDIPNVGRIAMIADPQGATLYIMAPTVAGPSLSFAPGKTGHASWNELRTTDAPAAFAFYSAHLGWGKSGEMDMGPMGPYILFNTGADQAGGIMRSPNFPHPVWLAYFSVDDIDAAAARLQSAGGTLVWGPQEVPGGDHVLHGTDPQGALFALLGPKPA